MFTVGKGTNEDNMLMPHTKIHCARYTIQGIRVSDCERGGVRHQVHNFAGESFLQ